MIGYSVIVPFYKGNKYIANIFKIFENNVNSLCNAGIAEEAELLIVNDSPECQVEIPKTYENIHFKIIKMERNSGIHKARVTGLNEASGEYILFLDQDDEVADDFLVKQHEAIGDADFVVANAWMEQSDGSRKKLYRSKRMMKKVLNEKTYIFSHNQIASPGQCLIKRTSIPKEWTLKILTQNGSDDLYLWLLFFEKGCHIMINYDAIYTHRYTGANLSDSVEKMTKSSLEFAGLLHGIDYFNKRHIQQLIRSRKFDLQLDSTNILIKILVILRYADIVLHRVIWKVMYR